MIIMGLDPGLTRCGVGVVQVESRRQILFRSVTVLTSNPDLNLAQRLGIIGHELETLLDDHKPDALSLERVFSQQNVSTVMGVAQISGVALYLAAARGIPVTLYTPSQVKAAVTGYGAADKRQVTSMVTKILRLEEAPKPADAADALALAITHAWNGVSVTRSADPDSGGLTPAQLAWHAAERKARRS